MEFVVVGFLCFLCFVWGIVTGWTAREKHAINRTKNLVEEIQEQVQEVVKDMIPIVVEKHQNTLYVYNKENNEFMAQGANVQELEENLNKRYPGKRFACSEEHMSLLKVM